MTEEDPPARRPAILDWKGAVGIALSLAFLYWAFRDVHFREIARHVSEADPVLLGLSVIVATVLFPIRALRWKPLLEPAYPQTRFHPRFAATCIGFMANNLLPARIGEFVRAYALSRLEPIRMSASFGSLVVERMFDAVVVVTMLVVSMAWPGFPDLSGTDFQGIALGLAAAVVVGFGILLMMVVRPERSVRLFERTVLRLLPSRVRRLIVDALRAFIGGVAAVREPRLIVRILAWSALLWSTNALAFWLGFLAFDIHLPLVAGFFLQSVIALAVSLPSAPGFFGLFEAGARIGLVDVWGVDSSRALAYAVGFHIATFLPVTFIGLYYVWRLGISWGEVKASEEAVETDVESQEPGAGATP